MSEKLYRIRVSTTIDLDIIGFLEVMPTPRRTELIRHILRYYASQLEEDGELFIIGEAPKSPDFLGFSPTSNTNKTKEYKVRLDESIDKHLVDLIERVPRKRRSEFWRHVLRYYMGCLKEGEFFIMPSEVVLSNSYLNDTTTVKEEEHREDPGAEILDNFTF